MLTLLKQSRMESGKTIEEISSDLKIRKQYLTALEENDLDVLPEEVYVKGYIKLYSNYLGISFSNIQEQGKDSMNDVVLQNRIKLLMFNYRWKKRLIILSILIISIICFLILKLE